MCVYVCPTYTCSGIYNNVLPLLQKPLQYGQEVAVLNPFPIVHCDFCIAETPYSEIGIPGSCPNCQISLNILMQE